MYGVAATELPESAKDACGVATWGDCGGNGRVPGVEKVCDRLGAYGAGAGGGKLLKELAGLANTWFEP